MVAGDYYLSINKSNSFIRHVLHNAHNISFMGSEDTHLRAVLSVSISQVKGLREKPRYVQLLACRYNMSR
jgi:hypothetical protein